ncbi:MAG: GNAT family N-acetyltransferase [Oscillospiraceae bacterium]|jgi:GNAT superfamily N-acetyltransferase|nr:GNAT family N-acetyltransferase [Oscillospiraceae bacterium]
MDIEIRKLTPDLAEDYARFFDTTPHNNEGNGEKCYCVIWRGDASYVGNDHWYPSSEERRERAIQFIRDGDLQGYLAYHGEGIVGWCNATADCQLGVKHLRSYWSIEEYPEDIKVKSIFCFMIAPEMQRKGVATALVERVCADAADEGFNYVEAYINKEFVAADHDFRGPLTMYEKCGFAVCAEREGRVTVRKALK